MFQLLNNVQVDFKNHIVEKYPRVRPENTYKCKNCLEEISDFYGLRKHKSSQHQIRTRTFNLSKNTLLENITDVEIKEELNSCKLFFVDCVLEKARHFVFDFAMSSFNNSFLNEELDHMYN